jgi:hypothetical protein
MASNDRETGVMARGLISFLDAEIQLTSIEAAAIAGIRYFTDRAKAGKFATRSPLALPHWPAFEMLLPYNRGGG